MKKELWIRLEDKETYVKKEKEILDIVNESKGDVKVILCVKKEQESMSLGKYVNLLDGRVIEELKALLGSENVKYTEQFEEYEEPKKRYTAVVNELCGVAGNYMGEIKPIEIMQISRLDRIADALEGINQELSCIAGHLEYLCDKDYPLDECISKTRAGSFLCVTGHVTTKNY